MKLFFEGGNRFTYQDQLVKFDIAPHSKVLDIGSGPAPFPYATVLCERFLDETVHRRGEIRTGGRPIVQGDIHQLPFQDKSFDFVYTSHVLEHVEDPIKACRELMRVARRGYLETPNFMKDMLFCQAKGMHHRWHTVAVKDTVFFFEYRPREIEGVRDLTWLKLMWSPFYHPLQEMFIRNQDIFNTMFLWTDTFKVQVVRQNGEIQSV